jgi:sarcosine oxidase subunit gamma
MASSYASDSMIPGRAALANRAGVSTASPEDGPIGLKVREVAHLGKLNIRCGNFAAKTIKANTGCAFPPDNNKVTSAGARHVVWLGPDEYLLLCEAGLESELKRKITAELAGQHFAITDVTDSLCALQLEGPKVRAVLAKGCALDLHPRQFTPGDCAQTFLSHAGVTLVAMDENCFLVICRTSFAPYMVDWLQDAAMEYGFSLKN